jgi:FHA domain
MSPKPRETPSAPAPRPSAAPGLLSAPVSTVLRAPVVVVGKNAEYELARGSLSLGRNTSADISIADPLVSRSHARLVVLGDGSVAVEDLHSTNGIYINGLRLGRNSQRLREGDRLLIGTCELSVFSARQPLDLEPVSASRESATHALTADAEEGAPATDRADALEMVARLAERLYRAGNSAEAVRVLSAHLNKVLLGASAGLAIPEPLLDEASRLAIGLFRWTYNAAWIDYVIELHLTAQRLPSEPSLAALEAALGTASGAQSDAHLLSYFIESLESRRAAMTLNEEARWLRLKHLVPKI